MNNKISSIDAIRNIDNNNNNNMDTEDTSTAILVSPVRNLTIKNNHININSKVKVSSNNNHTGTIGITISTYNDESPIRNPTCKQSILDQSLSPTNTTACSSPDNLVHTPTICPHAPKKLISTRPSITPKKPRSGKNLVCSPVINGEKGGSRDSRLGHLNFRKQQQISGGSNNTNNIYKPSPLRISRGGISRYNSIPSNKHNQQQPQSNRNNNKENNNPNKIKKLEINDSKLNNDNKLLKNPIVQTTKTMSTENPKSQATPMNCILNEKGID